MSNCKTCIHHDKKWYELPCDECTMGGETNHYEPVDNWDHYADLNGVEEDDESNS